MRDPRRPAYKEPGNDEFRPSLPEVYASVRVPVGGG